ncbi:MAG: 3-keto-5-aminohexanoate cleavage protein [Burkholderiales bacterium]
MANLTWLEVALNGGWGRRRQPGIPVSVAEIVDQGVACVHEGAAIVHVHAYDEATGHQHDDPDIYARIIEGIRTRVDCIVYPTIPAGGSQSAAARFAAIEALACRGLLEWAVVDPGSVNLDGFVYMNSDEHIRHGLDLAARHGFHPGYAIYEPGFMRLGARLAREIAPPQPIYRLMFSEGFAFGFPPAEYALEAYLRLLGQEAPGAPWMVAGLSVDVLPLAGAAAARGGHVRVGLEDAPFGAARSNVEWVRAAIRAIGAGGGAPATPADVRRSLNGRG